MSDDAEKPFAPTPSRIAKAKRDGNVVRAQEFAGTIAFIAACFAALAVVPLVAQSARHAIIAAASGNGSAGDGARIVTWALVPMAAAAAGGTAASLLQSGGFRISPVGAKLERLAPGPGLQRMFSAETVSHALRAVFAVLTTGAAMLPAMNDIFSAALHRSNPGSVALAAWNGAVRMIAATATLGLAFACVEYGVARRDWLRKLRMSLHELKRELKEQDGDPALRARRKSLHRDLIRGSVARVRDASFVVVNPTHLAVALEYRPPEIPVPRILVRAAGEMARFVREAAVASSIPIVENVPLARALYAEARVGDSIPVEHYVAVAEVVCALVRSGSLP